MDNKKKLLRINCKNIRNNINSESVSLKICSIVKNWNVFKQAKNVMLFYPIGNELSLLELLSVGEKNFYFPCVDGENISAAKYEGLNSFEIGMYSIPEPKGKRYTDCSFLDLVFVPALAVDSEGYRLGYGKGYYDRFLSRYQNLISVVPISSKLCFENIPHEQHDFKVNYYINENLIMPIPLSGD